MRRLIFALICASAARAQLGRTGAEWVTAGSDAQRSHSIPNDPKIGPGTMSGFQFLYKTKLEGALTPAILMDRYIGYRGFRSFAFVAGLSNTVWAIDSDLNRVEWTNRLPISAGDCAGVSVSRATGSAYPAPATFGGLGGRSAPAHSDVGESGEGAVTLEPALRSIEAAKAAAARPAPARAPSAPIPNVIYVVPGDGMLHQLYISNGIEPEKAIPFVPANSRAEGLIVMGHAAWITTHACGGESAGAWRLDLATRKVASWRVSGDIAGSEGPAFGPDGTIYVTTTRGEMAALDPETMAVKWRYTGGGEFVSSPVVFPFRGKTVVAAAAKDGRFHLVSGGSALAVSEAHGMSAGAVATWQSLDGTRWLVAAIPNSIVAWKVLDREGQTVLEPAWRSKEMSTPLAPIILSGVVFAAAGSSLYALDGITGKPLWNSGPAITSVGRIGGLSGGASQIYLSTENGTFYAFGFPMEH